LSGRLLNSCEIEGMRATPWLIGLLVTLQSSCLITARAGELTFESGPSKVHLVELFTSEGCSSCPPAEAWLTKLKQAPGLWRDFVPVAFHVDYWNHLGWRDRFASKEWTARQQGYAARWNLESVYTPGFVLDGHEWHAQELPNRSPEVIGSLQVKISGPEALLTFSPAKKEGRSYDVYLAQLGFGLASNVAAGENRGRKLTHDFVVLDLQKEPLAGDAKEAKLLLHAAEPEKNPSQAVAAWVTYAGELAPIQSAGGWLAQDAGSQPFSAAPAAGGPTHRD
jgi:hypothetical protein